MKASVKNYLHLHLLLLFSTLGGICSKIAGRFPLLSTGFILFYGLLVLILMIYAIMWQQIIKRMPLTTAYCNRAIVIVWGMLWGALLFKETITPTMVLGAAVVLVGVVLVVSADE